MQEKMNKPTGDLEQRLVEFAVRVVKVCDALPRSSAGKHVAGQLLRSGTSPAANYAEACNGESRSDFIHKLKIVQKELAESLTWLRIISRSGILKPARLNAVMDENLQLCKIITAFIKTSRSRLSNARSASSN